ncbi:MAG TPA: S46 family peptidase [Myxococcota bacterium]|nr:S46 family peptidase [Myxococcota bacterium]
MRFLMLTAVTLFAGVAHAEEGMWTFNRFPSDTVEKLYGFKPDAAWLEKVRLSSARLAQGCSASFVSPDGLVMTNHHCVHSCVEELSSPKKNYIADGFWAKTAGDELKCPNLEVNQLVSITDVTARVMKAAEGLDDAKGNEAKKAAMTAIEKECQTSDALRCEVVTLYNGGVYDLYQYKRHQDVRLVWAPELGIAFFGGDPDNFMFPRFTLDASFVRVYEGGENGKGGKPVKTEHYFKWSDAGAKDGQLTFVAGNPGSTSRLDTVAETKSHRDNGLVSRLMYLSEMRGALVEYARRGKEQARHSMSLLFGIENALKAFRGEAEALFAPGFLDGLQKAEDALKQKVLADKSLATTHGAWDAIAAAVDKARPLSKRHGMLEGATGFRSDLFNFARMLVRAAEERAKPNEKRLREYTDGRLPALAARLLSAAPVYPELEVFRLTFGLTKLREVLGPDDAVVKLVLGKESPEQVAKRLVKGSKLMDLKVRKQLYEGGADAIAKSQDPMILLARSVDGESRALRKTMEDEIEAPIRKHHELIAAARFKIQGTNTYPDATFSPRLSFGAVKGWLENGKPVAPYTTFSQTFERHTGSDPFALPKSWLAAKDQLDLTTPMNFVTTNDIIGGNSGSPVFDQDARIVGLIFDGNIHSLGGDYGFDASVNRAIAVDSRGILTALEKVYKVDRLVNELRGK